MKKIVLIALSVLILLSFTACDNSDCVKDITLEGAIEIALDDYGKEKSDVELTVAEEITDDDSKNYRIVFNEKGENENVEYLINESGTIVPDENTLVSTVKSLLYGVIEGITEWLPISSTGHLILFEELFKFSLGNDFMEFFRVIIQLGAIMAVVILYWKKIWPFHSKKTKNQIPWKNSIETGFYGSVQKFCNNYVYLDKIILWVKIIIACLPAAMLGLLLDDWLDEHLYNFVTVAITLLIYGVGFIIVENMRKKGTIKTTITSLSNLTFKTAFIIGGFQVLSMIPGTSRSGATILGAILIGCSREVAAEFSFFLAIPVMFGASLLKAVKLIGSIIFTPQIIICLITGILISFVVSVIAIKFLMGYIKKHDFKAFGYYRIVLAIILFIYMIFA